MCGVPRYKGGSHNTSKIQRHCRACNVNFENLDNLDQSCRYLAAETMDRIASHPSDALRQRWSQHELDNTFNHMPLADPIRGIFGATPVETMHAFRKGVIEVVTFLVLTNIPPTKKAALDVLAIRFHKSHRQTYRKAYPATDFSNGITNLTKISAAERLGLVFLFVILAQYDEGWQIMDTALTDKTTTDLARIVNTFECLLCFDAWLNHPTFWKLDDDPAVKAGYRASIVAQMQMCIDFIPTVRETSWKFPKFHELLHIVDDIERYGAPMNYCAQRPESLLIPVAKKPGRRAQKRQQGVRYELQAAQRLAYSVMIDTVYSRLWDSADNHPDNNANKAAQTDNDSPNTGRATFATVVRNDHPHVPWSKRITVKWDTETDTSKMDPPRVLSEFLLTTFGNPVRFCTECRMGKNIFRCHPDFQSDGALFDWMRAEFHGRVYPCRLAAVVVIHDDAINTDRLELVVQRATQTTGINSVLLTEWLWSSEYHVILPSDVKSPCFVVSIKEDSSKILETLPIEDWHNAF